MNLHGLSFLTMVLNVAVAVEMENMRNEAMGKTETVVNTRRFGKKSGLKVLKSSNKYKKSSSRFGRDAIKVEDVELGIEDMKYKEREATKDETEKDSRKDKRMKARVEREKAKEARLKKKRSVWSKLEEEGTFKEASKLSKGIIMMEVTQSKFDKVHNVDRGHGEECKIESESAAESDQLEAEVYAGQATSKVNRVVVTIGLDWWKIS